MIRLHERQLAMLVLHFCLRYTIQCITRVQQGPQSSILFRMGPPSNSSLPGPFIPVRHWQQSLPFQLPMTTHIHVLKHKMHLLWLLCIPRGTAISVVGLPTIDSNVQLVNQCVIIVRLIDIFVEYSGLKTNQEARQGMLLQYTLLRYVLSVLYLHSLRVCHMRYYLQ